MSETRLPRSFEYSGAALAFLATLILWRPRLDGTPPRRSIYCRFPPTLQESPLTPVLFTSENCRSIFSTTTSSRIRRFSMVYAYRVFVALNLALLFGNLRLLDAVLCSGLLGAPVYHASDYEISPQRKLSKFRFPNTHCSHLAPAASVEFDEKKRQQKDT